MRVFINIIAFAGLALFGCAFIASYANPGLVEALARDAIRSEVERRVSERIDALDGGRLAEMAKGLSGKNSLELAELKRKLAEGLPQKVAAIAAQMGNIDCECRKAIEKSMTGILERRVADLARVNERLELLIRTQYMGVAESLTREFRIFTGANALVFSLLAFAALLRRRAGLQLVLPTAVLLGAAGLVGYLYLFHQNWLHTILFSDYVGFGYFIYLALAVALLTDIVFNRARVTTRLLNAMFSAVGSTLQAVPC
ncbi:hypothetical protein PMI15_01255 [Polaromonas sp. CF318]|uniref:hypothetical protein n=1 Tax=Polaromonas sp. CF318 TaxID=1144318 RepID=UPI000270E2C0|nr:hypothetical protein [Polaromonas sp. CF318]EJL86916.1 hypothetical protein PMI15_01255 [Polaromonas sp. CF318]